MLKTIGGMMTRIVAKKYGPPKLFRCGDLREVTLAMIGNARKMTTLTRV